MLTDAERTASRDAAEHFKAESLEYERQRAEVAAILAKDRTNRSAMNRALRISDENVKLRRAIRDGDTSYRFPLCDDSEHGAPRPNVRKAIEQIATWPEA